MRTTRCPMANAGETSNMTLSKRQIANRTNAQRSTGPRSASGKASSRLNATKHGLAVPASALPDLAQEVAQLAQQIAGQGDENPAVREAATRVAEAAIDVLRVRQARTHVLGELMGTLDLPPPPPVEKRLPPLPSLPRQPTKGAMSRAYDEGGDAMMALWDAFFRERYQLEAEVRHIKREHRMAQERVKQHSQQLRLNWSRLEKLERYERRAMSRRQTAIKALTALEEPISPAREEEG